MVSCAVRSCCSRDEIDKKRASGITFHRFPKDLARRESWVKFVKRKGWQPSRYSVLCSKHFSEDAFDRSSQSYIRLRENAVPTLGQEIKQESISELTESVYLQPESGPSLKKFKSFNNTKTEIFNENNDPLKSENYEEYLSEIKIEHEPTLSEEDSFPFSKNSTEVKQEEICSSPEEPVDCNSDNDDSMEQVSTNIVNSELQNIGAPSSFLQTPLAAKLQLKTAYFTIQKQRRKIRTLQQRVRRFKAKADSYALLFKYLRQNNLVTEAGENVMKAFTKEKR